MKKALFYSMTVLVICMAVPAMAMADTTVVVGQGQEATVNGYNSSSTSYPNGIGISFPGLPNLFFSTPDAANIRNLYSLFTVKSVWTRQELVNALEGYDSGSVDLSGAPLNGQWVKKKDKDPNAEIRIILGPPSAENLKDVSLVIPLEAKGTKKAQSVKVFLLMALRALDAGANVLEIDAQGVEKELFAWALSVMVGGSASTIKPDVASLGGGGVGASYGKAGLDNLPFSQGSGLKLNETLKLTIKTLQSQLQVDLAQKIADVKAEEAAKIQGLKTQMPINIKVAPVINQK
jgi:hypothetical protein